MKNKNMMACMAMALFLILLSSLGLAIKESVNSFDAEVKPISDKITIYGNAKVTITVTNRLDIEDTYTLSFGDLTQWPTYYTVPFTDYLSGFEVDAKGTYTTEAYFSPDKEIGKGYRTVYITVKSKNTGSKIEFAIPVYMISLKDAEIGYLPNIGIDIDFPEKIDPRQKYDLKVNLKNYNIKNLSNVELHVDSDTIKEYLLASLGPEEKRTITFPIELDPLHQPQKDTLSVRANIGPYIFNAKTKDFEIIDYSAQFDEKSETSSLLWKITKSTVYKNVGNTEKTQTIKTAAPLLKSIFVSLDPKDYSVVKEEGARYYSWSLTLKPGEEKTVQVVTNYRILLYILIIIIALIAAYHMFRSPVQIVKMAKNIELHKGVISEVKVMLNLRNISSHSLENIEIVDNIPNMANITQDFDAGTVRPSKVMKHETQGYTIVQWNLETLDPNEDRLITYRIKSRLSIFGCFELPRTKVRYKTKSGSRRVVRSNKLVIQA